MDYLGNISMRLVAALATIGTLAAIYFFVIKPISDTTEDAFDAVSPAFENIDDALKQAAEAQKTANEAAKQTGSPGSKKQADKLQRCLKKAGKNTKKIENCLGL